MEENLKKDDIDESSDSESMDENTAEKLSAESDALRSESNKQAAIDNILKTSTTETLKKRGMINIYVRKDYVQYFSLLRIIVEKEEADIMKVMNKSQKRNKRSGVLSLGICKVVKNYCLYKKTHRDEKLLSPQDFTTDGRKDNF